MIKRLINYYNYYKRKRDIVDSFIKYSEYMLPGRYVFDETLTYIYLGDHHTSQKIVEMFKNSYLILSFNRSFLKSLILAIIKLRFFKNLNIKGNKKQTDFQGTAYLPGGAENDSKVFDLINSRVVIIFKEKQDYDIKIQNYQYFNKYFLIPEIISHDNEGLLIMEECIDFKINDKWLPEDYQIVIEEIFSNSIEYFKECKRKEQFNFKPISSLVSNKSEESLINLFANKHISKELLNIEWPFLKLHGDLWTSNILISKNNIYYIDWERSKEYIMLYDVLHIIWSDVLHIIWSDVLHKNNYTYMEKYINGKYDIFLKEIFDIFNLNFDKDLKVDYLSITILNYVVDRFDDNTEENYKYIFNEYEKVLNRIEVIQ